MEPHLNLSIPPTLPDLSSPGSKLLLSSEEGEGARLCLDNSHEDYLLYGCVKFYLSLLENNVSLENPTFPDTEISHSFPSQYTHPQIIVLAILITLMMVVVVVGNMLVIIAIATEHSLNLVQNWFIASLAFADLSLGLIIMPFSLAYELLGYWMFGSVWCDVHGALDVLLSTSSIMNLCLISLDRYWSITRAMDYLTSRTKTRVIIYIMAVWAFSAFISIPPLLGWKKDPDLSWFEELKEYQQDQNFSDYQFVDYMYKNLGNDDFSNFTQSLENAVFPKCQLSEDTGYVLYSAFGSFYIPSCIMVFVYINIYVAARTRARRHIKPKGSLMKKENYSMGPQTKIVDTAKSAKESVVKRSKFGDSQLNGKLKNQKNHQVPSDHLLSPAEENQPSSNGIGLTAKAELDQKRENGLSASNGGSELAAPSSSPQSPRVNFDEKKDSQHQTEEKEENGNNGDNTGTALREVKGENGKLLTNNNVDGELSSDCSHPASGCIRIKSRILPKLRLGRRLSKEAREMIDIGRVAAVSKTVDKTAQESEKINTEKEKRRIARLKERRATLILGMIMGSFIACWLPFFVLYVISPVCPICPPEPISDVGICVPGTLFSTAFWLGYSNSAFNPVIYTVFNNDFRRAFKKILFK